jgi:hypothetical protein
VEEERELTLSRRRAGGARGSPSVRSAAKPEPKARGSPSVRSAAEPEARADLLPSVRPLRSRARGVRRSPSVRRSTAEPEARADLRPSVRSAAVDGDEREEDEEDLASGRRVGTPASGDGGGASSPMAGLRRDARAQP